MRTLTPNFLLYAAAVAFLEPTLASASYAIFVGSGLTADGSTFLGGTGDEPSSHWLEIVPRAQHPAGSTIRVGVTNEANFAGELIEIPQVALTARYITMNYSEYEGFPAPLTNGGLNEYGVAARDVWSPSREELQKITARPQHGLNYSDLSRIVMERAHSAREAVKITGELIDKYGYATYGGNSHFFADAAEGWVLIDFAGSQGLWIAERIGPNEVRMSYPGYIMNIPLDFQKHPDRYRGSANFISFAVSQGWFDPKSGKPFNVNAVYGSDKGKSAAVKVIESRLREKAAVAKITLRDMMDTVRDPLVSGDQNGYGQIAHLRQGMLHPELNVLWVAATGSITSPFVPYWIAVDTVLPEYGRHRYLSHRESEGFVSRDWQIQEASQFAYVTFKRLMYYTCDKPAKFLPEVTEALAAFENQSIEESRSIEATAAKLLEVREPDMARRILTSYSSQRAGDALRLGESLLASIEARYRLLYGFRAPQGQQMSISDDDRAALVACGKVLPWE
ncbi:MAG TPA: C69 family dipeptidase [Candidatus Margulisiibacteriota bacterium]|nr:C69 family dipeptidase [Candidatus Margulisiibacteriota bacterium]